MTTIIEFKQKVKTDSNNQQYVTLKTAFKRDDVVSKNLPNHDLAMQMLNRKIRKSLDILPELKLNSRKFYLNSLPNNIMVDTSDFLAKITLMVD